MPKILAIDDINDNLISLKAIISDAFPNAVVFTALNGPKGIELAIASNPDVILLDVIMPGMDGFEVCRRLKQDERVSDIPVVFLTAIKGDKESRIKALEVGAEGFLSKPIDETELIAQIRAMVKIKAATDHKRDENARLVKLVHERTRELQDELDERKKAEEALFRNEERFKQVAECSGTWIWEVDANGLYTYVNDYGENILGYTPEEVTGKKYFYDFFAPEVKDDLKKEAMVFFEQKRSFRNFENPNIHKDGHLVILETVGFPVIDTDGTLLGFRGADKDITERKAAVEELRSSKESYQRIIDNVDEIIYSVLFNGKTISGTVNFVSGQATKILGYTPEEFMTNPELWFTLIHPDDAERIERQTTLCFENKKFETRIYRMKHKLTGEYLWMDDRPQFLYDKDENIIGQFGTARDITERKQAEELLFESEYFFKESQRAAFVGSYKFDLIADFWTSSEVLEQIFGIDKSFTRSLGGWLQIAHPDDREMMARYFSEEVVSKRNPFNKEYRIIRKSDGETRWVLGLGKLTFDADDNVVEMIGTIQDITDRKRIEASLIETNEFSNSLLQTIPFGMDIVDEHGNILFQNEQMSEIFGGNTVGKKCWELYRDDKSQCIDCPLLSGIKIGATEIYESRGVLGNKIFQISHTGMMFRGQKAMLEIFQDITGRKESETALQESEERYRRFISQVSEGVYRFESDEPMDLSLPMEEQIDFMYDHLTIAECNDAFLKMYGVTNQNEMIGKTMIDLHGGKNNEYNRVVLSKFVENNYHVEETLTEELNALGQKIYISNTSIGILENNKLVRIWGTQTDISSRVRASQVQQVLYSISNAALSSIDLSELIEFISKEIGKLLDSTNFYIAFYDEETNMLSTLYERDEKDVLDSWPAEKSITGYVIKHQKSMRITYEDVKKLCDTGEIEMFGTPSEVWLGVPLVMNKKVIGALVVQSYDDPEAYTEEDKLMLEFISHQISISIERKKAEQELNDALAKAQESDRLKSAFLANMSHEIRTPLNSIIGFSELMSDPDFGDMQRLEFSRMINASGNNLLTIITDIMDLSKIEAGQVVVRKELVSVNELIRDIHKEYSFMAGKKGIRLEIDLSEIEEQIEIESDESALRKILINFVGNAIKFTKEGFIEIGVRPVGKYLQFHVKDTGIGIPSEFHKTIFERFRQIESFSTRKYGGNGLGLAISKSLVELLGGKIWMESESGVGSTFYFAVPVEDKFE